MGGDGEGLPSAIVADVLFKLTRWIRGKKGLPNLKAALLPYAMAALQDDTLPQSHGIKLVRVLSFLGQVAVPHLVAWLGLLERPLSCHNQWKAEELRTREFSARVHLAARFAISDRGGPSVARVEELCKLRASLGRDAKVASVEDRTLLEAFRAEARASLQSLKEHSDDCHIRYAADRALRR